MAVTVATILARIRVKLNEATQRFYPSSADTGLIEWYNDGASQQHRIVLEMAEKMRMLPNVGHHYLRQFSKYYPFFVKVNIIDYDVPETLLKVASLKLWDASNMHYKFARYIELGDFWEANNIPHLMPAFDQPAYGFQMGTDGNIKLRIFAFGVGNVPNAPFNAELTHYRDVARALDTGNVDLLDPYNEGPIDYACGVATEKRGQDGASYFASSERKSQAILMPVAAAQGATQAASAVQAGEGAKAIVERRAG